MTFDGRSLTRKLLSFSTINPPGYDRDCSQFFGYLLEQAGYETRYQEFREPLDADCLARRQRRQAAALFHRSFGHGAVGCDAVGAPSAGLYVMFVGQEYCAKKQPAEKK